MPYITPENTPIEILCWRIYVPNDLKFRAAIRGQLYELVEAFNWEQTSGITVDETTQLAATMFYDMPEETACMIGSLVHYLTTNPPSGILPCDGTQYLRTDYPILYAALPASLIVDADNFITPTIEDAFLLGAGTTYLPEDTGGEIDHTLIEVEMPAHIHQTAYPQLTVDIKSVGAPTIESASNPPVYLPSQSTGGNESHNNMPPFVAYKVGLVAR